MNTFDFIIALFCRVDDQMQALPKHPQAKLYPSEVVTLAMLFTRKGVGERAFYRWLKCNYLELFPHLPSRGLACSACSRRIKTGQSNF